MSGKGAKIGPQLDGIGIRGLERLLEDTLDPSRNVDQAFRTTILNLKSGQVVSGLLLKEEGEVLVLADAAGKGSTRAQERGRGQANIPAVANAGQRRGPNCGKGLLRSIGVSISTTSGRQVTCLAACSLAIRLAKLQVPPSSQAGIHHGR